MNSEKWALIIEVLAKQKPSIVERTVNDESHVDRGFIPLEVFHLVPLKKETVRELIEHGYDIEIDDKGLAIIDIWP